MAKGVCQHHRKQEGFGAKVIGVVWSNKKVRADPQLVSIVITAFESVVLGHLTSTGEMPQDVMAGQWEVVCRVQSCCSRLRHGSIIKAGFPVVLLTACVGSSPGE